MNAGTGSSGGHPAAFAAESIRAGAALPVSGETIVSTVERRLTRSASVTEGSDQWLAEDIPLLSRGGAWIVPLSWEPPEPADDASEQERVKAAADELWLAVRSSCSHRGGNQIAVDLAAPSGQRRSYAAELTRTGARRADWWGFGESALVLVVYGEPLPAPKRLMAVHVVPIGWVSDRRPKEMPPTDLSWSWADVVDLAQAGSSEPPDSLGPRRGEGEGS